MNIHNIIYKHSLLSDICKVLLSKYFNEVKDKELKNTILTNFVNENRNFFRCDEHINKWLLSIQSHVPFEFSSSSCTSSSESSDQESNLSEGFQIPLDYDPNSIGI